MSSPFSAPPRLLGVRLTDVSTTQRHELGSVIVGVDGVQYRYIKAGEAIAVNKAVDYTSAFVASVTDAGDYFFGIAQTALAINEYGWIAEKGVVSALVGGTPAAGSSLARDCTTGGALNVVTTGDGVEVPAAVTLSAVGAGTETVILF
jgi:hypothetical protein